VGRLSQRLAVARQALRKLCALPLEGEVMDVQRDAAIQRFEYSFEAIWRAAQAFLSEVGGLEAGSAKGTVRASYKTGIPSEEDACAALQMADDRNLTIHTYNQALAEEILARLASHARTLDAWLDSRKRRQG